MKKLIIPFCLFYLNVSSQTILSYKKTEKGITINTQEGELSLLPLAHNAIRVKLVKDKSLSLPELIYTEKVATPTFKVNEFQNVLSVGTVSIKANYDKTTGELSFYDKSGKLLLKESQHSRSLIGGITAKEPSFTAKESFDSPNDEALFGLGQFQDNQFNLRNVPRDLIQLNTQVSIPFYYSSKGYGLLWHQYGETRFNLPHDTIALTKTQGQEQVGKTVEATTDAGTKKFKLTSQSYSGSFNIKAAGRYVFFLNYGNMENKHWLTIDGKQILNQTNTWLPFAASAFVTLVAGNHVVEVISKEQNNPQLSFQPVGNQTVLESPNAKLLDYTVFSGPSGDTIIKTLRKLSGQVPMLPEHTFGFWQCKERYHSSTELINTVAEFRKMQIPLDIIVQDWQYWGKYGWGAIQFDEKDYPDPKGMLDSLHQLHAHLTVSVWEAVNKQCHAGKEYEANKYYMGGVVDVLNPEARQAHWGNMNREMFQKGVDGWWMDAVEPENDKMHNAATYLGPGDFFRLTYPLHVSQAVYEGQRKETSKKRVNILTRCAFLGEQRYGSIIWSGDVGSTWDAFKRQINAGLGYTITGLPYFTTDIGGFFRPKAIQYTDTAYHELLIRWFQYGTFNPILRIHGYQTNTELWNYGKTVLDDCKKMIDLRYRLIPYIYSTAWQVTNNNCSLMKALPMDFRTDTAVYTKNQQFMFGPAFLVSPVVEPGVKTFPVYLPKPANWIDFYTGKKYVGGQTVKADAPLDKIPLFVKSGSIVPMGKLMQYVGEKQEDTLEIRVYPGANGSFTLYEDEGDNYNYEKGKYSVISFVWNDALQQLTIGKRIGSFEGLLGKRIFNIIKVSNGKGVGAFDAVKGKYLNYNGGELRVKL